MEDVVTADERGNRRLGVPESYTRTTTVTVTHHGGRMVGVRSVLEDPDHLMTAELDVEVPSRRITRAVFVIDRAPFPGCLGPAGAAGSLEGLVIERGFTSRAASIVGGRDGCAHLFETVVAAARLASSAVTHVAAGSTEWDTMYHDDEEFRRAMAPYLKDTCVVFRDEGEGGCSG